MVYVKNMESIDEIIQKENILYKFTLLKILKKIILMYKYLFNIITIKNFEGRKIYIIPWKAEKNKYIKSKKLKNLYEKISKKNTEEKFIILSNELNKDDSMINILYKNKKRVFDGRWLFNILIEEVVKYITVCKNKKLNEQLITILVNNPSETAMTNIRSLAKQVKNLKIVTNNNKYFRRIERQLYEENGIPVSIVNNKKKSLLNSDIIINIDFSEKEINKYNLNKKSIIVNINNDVCINTKSFNGINVKWYKISISKEYMDLFKKYNLEKQFDINLLYESFIYSQNKLKNVKDTIKNDNARIEYLIGTKGKIDEAEYLNNT